MKILRLFTSMIALVLALGSVAHAQARHGMMGSGSGSDSFKGHDGLEMDHNLVLPQIAAGEHYTTSIFLLNLGDPSRMAWPSAQSFQTTGKIYFYKQDGKGLLVSVNGKPVSSEYAFSLDASESAYLDIVSKGADTSGWALIQIDDSAEKGSDWGKMDDHEMTRGNRVMATAFYTLKDGVKTLSRVGVVPSTFEMGRYLTSLLAVQSDDDLYTGVAIVNTSAKTASVDLQLKDANGKRVATTALTLAPGNQTARFIHELFGSAVTSRFQGFLEVNTKDEGIVTLGLLVSQGILTSIPTHHYGQWNGMMR